MEKRRSVIMSIVVIIGCLSIIEGIGVLFADIVFARFLFGLGVFTGMMILWLADVFTYIILTSKTKQNEPNINRQANQRSK